MTEPTTIQITGDSNDTNLVLGSASAVVSDGDNSATSAQLTAAQLLEATTQSQLTTSQGQLTTSQGQLTAAQSSVASLTSSISSLTTEKNALQTALDVENNDYITFMLNGKEITILNPDPETSLVNYLRDTLYLTGTKVSCNQGFCGVCTVMVSYKDVLGYHNESVNSCLLKIVNCHGKAVTTVESMQNATRVKANTLHPIQEYFHELGALQCGYCTTGMEMRMYSTFQDKSNLPTFKNVEDHLSGNICRCTGFRPIIEAYKALLVSIVEGTSGVNKADVLGDANYSAEYDALKAKWAIGQSHGLPVYNLDVENVNNTTVNSVMTTFLDNSVAKQSVFESSIWDNYKFYTPRTLAELDTLIYTLNANEVMFVNGLTSFSAPGFSDIIHAKKSLVSVHAIPELKSLSVVSGNDFVFGSGLNQTTVADALENSTDDKYKHMASMIQFITASSVRNLGTWVGSLMMTLKSGFRGDWATMLAGSKATFTYAVYNVVSGTKTVKENQSFATLATDANVNPVVLVHSVKVPKSATNEHFVYQRVAKRMQNAQAYANAAISATTSGTFPDLSFSNMTIAVGAVTGTGVQMFTPSGTFSKTNLANLLNSLSAINVVDEHTFIDKAPKTDTIKHLVYGLVSKYVLGEVDLKLTKASAYGYQEFNSGAIDNGDDDYPTLSKDGLTKPHKMILQGGLVEDSSNNSGLFKLQNRDQIEDIVPRGENFTDVGRAKPQRDSFWKVQGKLKYATEMNIDALHIEMIYANIAKGTVNYDLQANKVLLEQYRNYTGVKGVLVYDDWFKNEFLENPESDEYQQKYLWNDTFDGKISVFNNQFYPGFTKYSNIGTKTKFPSGFVPVGLDTLMSTTIVNYGQIIGCVISNNLDVSRYVALKISDNLQHNDDSANATLQMLDSSYNFKPDDVLNNSNTHTRQYSKTFGNNEGLLTGYLQNVTDPSQSVIESQLEEGDYLLTDYGATPPGPYPGLPYASRKYNYRTIYPPNYDNEKKGAFFVNLDASSAYLKSTLGENIIPINGADGWVDFSNALTGNGWMSINTNYKDWYSTYDASFGEYAGQIYTESQTSNPLEGLAFTMNYIDGRNIECFLNSQDVIILSFFEQIRERLAPKYKINYYDLSGNHVKSSETSQIDSRLLASGGSFGSKFWMTVGAKIEAGLLSILYLRQPVKYMELWKYTENAFTGRPNYINKYKLSVDNTSKKITLSINDIYVINDFGSQNAPFASFLFNSSLSTTYNINNFAARSTIVRQNIGYTGYQRAIMEAESLGVLQTQFSRASALLKEPQYKIILNQILQFDNDDRITHDDTSNENVKNSTGWFRDSALSKEMLMKELEVALLKNLYNTDKNKLELALDQTKIVNLNTKAQITTAFDHYYDKAVTEFNATSKFKKRGMSIIPQVYLMPQSFVPSSKVGLELDSRTGKLIITTATKDQGTGSFQNSVDIIADYLKLDNEMFSYETNTKLSNSSVFVHAGSTGKVAIHQGSMNAGKKMLEKLLYKYRVNPLYSGNLYGGVTVANPFVNDLSLGGVDANQANFSRWFSFPKVLVDRGIVDNLDNSTSQTTNEVKLDLDGVYTYDNSGDLHFAYYQALGLPSLAVLPNDLSDNENLTYPVDPSFNDTYWTIDLRKFSGEQIIKIYNQFFTGNNWQGRLAQWAYIPSLAIGGTFTPGITQPTQLVNTLVNVDPPDLHRELVTRTLEYEYGVDFAIPAEIASSYGFPAGKAVFMPGENGYVWDISYYSRLTNISDPSYIKVITKIDMTNRWPFMLQYYQNSADERYAGVSTLPIPYGASAYTKINNIHTGNLGSEVLGLSIGGKKESPLTPEINGGLSKLVFAGAMVGLFGVTLDTLSVEGHGYENSNSNTLSVDTPSWAFNFHTSYVLGFNLVELDILTGEWVNKRSEVLANIDRSINPLCDIGQLDGGFMFGIGMWTSESSSDILENGKRLLEGHWYNKLPTAKVCSEQYNSTLLNRDDAYRTAQGKLKGVGELATGVANSVPSSIRDAIRIWREQVNTKAATSAGAIISPFANDNITSHDSCSYMDKLCFTYIDRIKESTKVSADVMQYMANN